MTSVSQLLRGCKAWHVGHGELTGTGEIPNGLSMKRSIEQVIIKREQLMRFGKSDGAIVPMKVCNASGRKGTTTTTAARGNTVHAQK